MKMIASTLLILGTFAGSSWGQTSAALDFLRVPPDVGYRKVDVIVDEIFDVTSGSNILTLLEGTSWKGSGTILLPVEQIVILPIPSEPQFAVAYSAGMTDIVRLVKGTPVVRSGLLVRVVDKSDSGGVLKLSNGDVVELGYDSYRAATWLVPFNAILSGDILYNLKKGRSVRFRKF